MRCLLGAVLLALCAVRNILIAKIRLITQLHALKPLKAAFSSVLQLQCVGLRTPALHTAEIAQSLKALCVCTSP